MLPKKHLIINLILSLIFLYFTTPFNAGIIFLSSILIDIDHYFYYIFEKKNFSLKKAYFWFRIQRSRFIKLSKEERKKHKYFIFVFHGLEILIVLFILSYYYPIFFFIFIGFLIHLAEDSAEAFKLNVLERKLFLSYAIYMHWKNRVK